MFWIIGVVLIVIALAFMVPSLLRQQPLEDDTREQNIAIAKEQLADLESRFEKNEISESDYQETKEELEFSLFNDLKNTGLDKASRSAKDNFSWLVLLLVPLIAVPLYLEFGNLDYAEQVDPKEFAKKAPVSDIPPLADGQPDFERMVDSLKYEVKNDPTSFEGWYMLGRSYTSLKKHPDAIDPLEKALALKPDDVRTMLSLVDALAVSKKNKLEGRSRELLSKVLTLEPTNATALWLSGMAASQARDFSEAIKHWEALLPFLDARPQDKKAVTRLILAAKKHVSPAQLASFASQQQQMSNKKSETREASAPSESSGVKVSIALSDEFKSKVSENDFVFIYAKAMNGPPMPLAAVKKQVKDLPIEIELNDQMAMMPGLTLSSFKEVSVGARVSKSGQPIAQSGDLFDEKSDISLGDKVSIEIDKVYTK